MRRAAKYFNGVVGYIVIDRNEGERLIRCLKSIQAE
jgi:hypothetical protein